MLSQALLVVQRLSPAEAHELQSIFPQKVNGHGFLTRGYIGDHAKLTKLQEGSQFPTLMVPR